jgi:hypothetical protein
MDSIFWALDSLQSAAPWLESIEGSIYSVLR